MSRQPHWATMENQIDMSAMELFGIYHIFFHERSCYYFGQSQIFCLKYKSNHLVCQKNPSHILQGILVNCTEYYKRCYEVFKSNITLFHHFLSFMKIYYILAAKYLCFLFMIRKRIKLLKFEFKIFYFE